MRYLMDTDWVINYLRNARRYVERIRRIEPEGIGLSIVSLAEIYEGIYSSADTSREMAGLERFLQRVEIIPLDDETCRIFGQVRGQLRGQGALIGDIDTFIGATALRHDLTLLSNNRRHFERISGLSIISS